MPRLRVVAGTSLCDLRPISVNTDTPHAVSSDIFEGHIVAHIKGFTDPDGNVRDSEYFAREDKKGITWSIQVQGRFLRPISADDVLFGNTFDRPLQLPWGSGAAFRFMKYIDPTLEHDLASKTKPWALSPLISTMPHFQHMRADDSDTEQSAIVFPPKTSIRDDLSQLACALRPSSPASSRSSSSSFASFNSDASLSGSAPHSASSHSSEPDPDTDYSPKHLSTLSVRKKLSKISIGTRKGRKQRCSPISPSDARASPIDSITDANQRRTFFADAQRRKDIVFGPEDIITTDFCYGFMAFQPTLSLQLPGGLSFDLMRYWDGQPVRFVCCERKRVNYDDDSDEDDDVPWGRILWCVAIEMVDDE